jgi:hypothetical protein
MGSTSMWPPARGHPRHVLEDARRPAGLPPDSEKELNRIFATRQRVATAIAAAAALAISCPVAGASAAPGAGLPVTGGLPLSSGLPTGGLPLSSGLPTGGLPVSSGLPTGGLPAFGGAPFSPAACGTAAAEGQGAAGVDTHVCVGAGLVFVGPAIGQIATVIGPTIIGPAVIGTSVISAGNVITAP